MKKLIALIVLNIFLTGCMTLGGPKEADPNHALYISAVIKQIEAERKPLIEFSIDSEGRMTDFACYAQPEHVEIKQKGPHPFFRLAEVGLKYFGWIGLAWQTGEALEGIIEASTGNVTNMNSYNNNSKNAGIITTTSDYATTKTETFETNAEASQ